MTEKNQQYRQQSHCQFEPSKAILDDWKLWLAFEVITQWKEEKSVQLNVTSICSQLNLINSDVFDPVSQYLLGKINSLKTRASSLEELHHYRRELEKLYSKTVFRELHKVGQELKINSTKHLQKSLSKDISQASPKKLGKFLEDVSEILFSQRQYFEEQRIHHQITKESALKAYCKLNSSSNADSIWNAISLTLNSQLQIEICSICSHIVFHLIQLCQSYSSITHSSLVMLEKVEASIKKKCSINLISLPVFTLLNKIDVDHQRNLIEIWIGHYINYWGNTPVTWQQLETKLLQNIEGEARKLYFDFQVCFLEHINISPEFKN